MELYSFFQSSSAYRVRIALAIKGLSPAIHPINLTKGEQRDAAYRAVNPQMVVPTLIDDGARLTQSIAIMEYLDETVPEPALLPKDPVARAKVRAAVQLIASDIAPLNNLKVRQYLVNTLGVSEDARTTWIRHWIADGFTALEAELAAAPTHRFMFGETPGMADCCLIPQLFNARRFQCDLAPYPTILRIAEACEQHPAFITAHPANQLDAA